MTGMEWALISLVLIIGFYMAWNIGANDVANAMGTSVGSRALTLKQAVILAGIFEFLGAFLVGGNVAKTVRKGIFDPTVLDTIYPAADFGDTYAASVLACGMIAALMSAGTWLLIASYFGWPVSTTHSIVGAVVGVGIAAVGAASIAWNQVGLITVGWIVSPLMSGAVAYMLFRFVLQRVFYKPDPVLAAKQVAPWLACLVLIVLIGVAAFKGLKPLWEDLGLDPFEPRVLLTVVTTAIVAGIIGMLVTQRLVMDITSSATSLSGVSPDASRSLTKAAMHLRRVANQSDQQVSQRAIAVLDQINDLRSEVNEKVEFGTNSEQLRKVERIFVFLQILTACFVAFSHGSNDVANAIGPLSAAYQAVRTGQVATSSEVPAWALVLGGIGIIVGLATWGWRVIQTVGEKITELTPSRGFCAEFAAAIVILLASIMPLGLPVSTTHTLVGAVLGVGLARGLGSLNLAVLKNIVASWFVTIPVGATLAIGFFFVLKILFLDLWGV